MITEQINERKAEIEQELVELLDQANNGFTLDDIKKIIYDEEDQDDLMKIVSMFDTGQGAIELENVLELASDAWNYFPHKVLNGLSPAEISLHNQK